MGTVIFRTIIIYIVLTIAVRVMGKRQLGDLQPMDLIITIIIADFATVPLQDIGVPISQGVLPLLLLMSLESILSFIILKINPLRRVMHGHPSFIINDCRIDQNEMKRLHLSVEDLIEEIRIAGAYSIDDVRYAIIETNGNWSVFLKEEASPLTPDTLGMKPQSHPIPTTIICDGTVKLDNLTKLNLDKQWLNNVLSHNKIKGPKDILYMSVSEPDVYKIIKKEI